MTDERTSHERLEDALTPAEEKRKPAEVTPFITSVMGKDRARDVEAQKSGQISRLYDLSGGRK